VVKVIITGGSGRLGKDLQILFSQAYEVLAPAHGELDITDFKQVNAYCEVHKPDLIVHSAAEADADACQLDPSMAYLMNTLATQNLVSACVSVNAAMAFVSTDYVFDGLKGSPYTEFDPPHPINVYGQSKLSAENYIRESLQKYYIIRTAWLFGVHGNNFLTGVVKAAETGSTVKAAIDQIGSPTNTVDLSNALLRLIDTSYYGIYNIVNRGILNWYEYAQLILKRAGKQARIEPILKEERGPAPRPSNTSLINMCLDLREIYDMPEIKEAIDACLSELS